MQNKIPTPGNITAKSSGVMLGAKGETVVVKEVTMHCLLMRRRCWMKQFFVGLLRMPYT